MVIYMLSRCQQVFFNNNNLYALLIYNFNYNFLFYFSLNCYLLRNSKNIRESALNEKLNSLNLLVSYPVVPGFCWLVMIKRLIFDQKLVSTGISQ